MTKQKKRIYNPTTKTYYKIRQRSSSAGKKGTISGKWSPKNSSASTIRRGARVTFKRYENTFKWLGGADRK